jgi:hypothetical protein
MFVQLHDPNLAGHIDFETDDTAELQDLLSYAVGRWTNLPGTDGAVLLSEPTAWVFLFDPAEFWGDPYPDFIVTEHAVDFA